MLFAEVESGWMIGLGTVAGTLLGAVFAFLLKSGTQKGRRRSKDIADAYERVCELLDRSLHQVDLLYDELSRRLVAERAARDQAVHAMAQNVYLWAQAEQYHQLLTAHTIECTPLPEKPEVSTPEATKAELEYVARTRRHNTDLISTEVAQIKEERKRDSDKFEKKSPVEPS